MKKLLYSWIGEDWGEKEGTDGDQVTFTLPPPPVIRRGGENKVRKRNVLSSSVITDFFSPQPKRRKMDRFDEKSWSDEEGFMIARRIQDDLSVEIMIPSSPYRTSHVLGSAPGTTTVQACVWDIG